MNKVLDGNGGLEARIRACRVCADRFRDSATSHEPRPVFWCRPSARILVAGQAPGARVHESGIPFLDRSGDRLRSWMGVSSDEFYDKDRIAILPMAFCFPGYDRRGADLPPPPACAATWRAEAMSALPNIETVLLVGAHAHKWHLGRDALPSVTANVLAWRRHEPAHYPLPHPSWRNNGWLARNPWFERDLLPRMRERIRRVLEQA